LVETLVCTVRQSYHKTGGHVPGWQSRFAAWNRGPMRVRMKLSGAGHGYFLQPRIAPSSCPSRAFRPFPSLCRS
jgi:hypothetical protein